MSGKTSRTKGHSFERAIAGKLRTMLKQDDIWREYENREGKGYDVDAWPFLVQAKAYKSYVSVTKLFEPVIGGQYKAKAWSPRGLNTAYKQFKMQYPNRIPVLFNKADYLPTVVSFFEKDAEKLMAAYIEKLERDDAVSELRQE